MKRVVERGSLSVRRSTELVDRIFAVGESRGDAQGPVRVLLLDRLEPGADAGFARVDFLASADEANNEGPIGVAIEARDEELRFGLRESSSALLSSHEVGGLFEIPGSLCLVEDCYVLGGRPW